MAIMKWEPFRNIDRIFEDGFSLRRGLSAPMDLSVDVYEKGDNVIVEMHVAGIDPEKLDITVEDSFLRVSGEKEESKEEEDKNYYYKEIQKGSFERAIRLPTNVKDEEVTAEYDNGVLSVTLPKENVEKKHKEIKVKTKSEKKESKSVDSKKKE